MAWPIVMVPITNKDDWAPRRAALNADEDARNVFAYLNYWQSVIEQPSVVLAINKALREKFGDMAIPNPLEVKMTFNLDHGAAFVTELPKLYAPDLRVQIRFDLV